MKNLFYIFFILLLSSCKLAKECNRINNIDIDSLYNNIIIDTTNNITKPIDSESFNKNLESYIMDRNIPAPKPNNNIEKKKSDRKPSSTNDIEDKTTNRQLQDTNMGIIAYSVPKEMQVAKTYTVRLRISKEKNKIQLIDGNDMPISDIRVDSKIVIASLKVEPIMSAKLITDSSKMTVQPVSTEAQDIDKEGFTEWTWRLTPKSSGNILLRIVVNIRQNNEGDMIIKDIPVYDDIVLVKSNVAFSVRDFISKYWQWIMTTIIIPFIVWFYNKKKSSS
jgi:hypothetical protein